MNESMKMTESERVAQARVLAEQAGYPLHDRYGYPASLQSVLYILHSIDSHSGDQEVVDAIGLGNMTGECQLAMSVDQPTDEEYEWGIVQALRGLEQGANR